MTQNAPMLIRRAAVAVFLMAAVVALFSAMALADGSVDRGRQMAERLCTRCHAIAGPGPSPVAQAPAFSTLHRKFRVDDLAEAFAEGIVTGHGPVRMPEFVFSPEEIDDLLAYLDSVQM